MKVWIQGARPKTLPAAIAPVLVGTALAGDSLSLGHAALALIVSLSLQIGVNYANDYSDGIRGTDAVRVGPVRITASGLASATSVKRAAFLSFLVAAIAGLVLAAASSWWLIGVGASAIVAAWGYTGGKNPYGYIGLGEIFVFIYFGLVATIGTYYVQSGTIDRRSILAAIPVGLLACLILAMNNIRDRAQDAQVGKRTSAVRLGDKAARRWAVAMMLLAHLMPLTISWPAFFATALISPLSYSVARGLLVGASGNELIAYIARTGKLHILYSSALSLGLLL